MHVRLDRCDTALFLDRGKLPERVFQRKPNDIWRVRCTPLAPDQNEATDWTLVRDGDLVRVPLVPYLCDADVSVCMAAVLERGIMLGALRQLSFDEMYVVMGKTIESIDDHYRFWLGVAIK